MGLWFKKKTKQEELLNFNRTYLRDTALVLIKRLYEYRKEEGFKLLKELLVIEKNYKTLALSESKDEQNFHYRKGEIDALSSFIDTLETALENERLYHKNEGKVDRGVKRVERQGSAANY